MSQLVAPSASTPRQASSLGESKSPSNAPPATGESKKTKPTDQPKSQMLKIQGSNMLPRRPVDENSRHIPLRNPDQKFVAINLAHQNQKLKCPVASFRILGFFETADDVREHTGPTPELDVFTVPVFSWFPITRGPVENPETRTQQVVDRVKAYIASRTDD